MIGLLYNIQLRIASGNEERCQKYPIPTDEFIVLYFVMRLKGWGLMDCV
jgi:hypothetical protein